MEEEEPNDMDEEDVDYSENLNTHVEQALRCLAGYSVKVETAVDFKETQEKDGWLKQLSWGNLTLPSQFFYRRQESRPSLLPDS